MIKCSKCGNSLINGMGTQCKCVVSTWKGKHPDPKCLNCRGTGVRTVGNGADDNDVTNCECVEEIDRESTEPKEMNNEV